MLTRRMALLVALALPWPAMARPTRYRLDPASSRVGFTYWLSGAAQTGEMPVIRADLVIDPTNLAASTADVAVSARQARTGFFFATQALKSAAMLNAAQFPEIRFVSTAVRLSPSGRFSDGATLTGDLTVRGITQQVTLKADLFRAAGSERGDLSRLTIRLTGEISRTAFGATAYPDLVADTVGLDIRASIEAVP